MAFGIRTIPRVTGWNVSKARKVQGIQIVRELNDMLHMSKQDAAVLMKHVIRDDCKLNARLEHGVAVVRREGLPNIVEYLDQFHSRMAACSLCDRLPRIVDEKDSGEVHVEISWGCVDFCDFSWSGTDTFVIQDNTIKRIDRVMSVFVESNNL